MDRPRTLRTYRGLIRAILKYERPSKIVNWGNLRKAMITKLEYAKKQNQRDSHENINRQLEKWKN